MTGRVIIYPTMEPLARKEKLLLIFVPVLSVSLFAVLYGLRQFDDNRLTSWRWVFEHVSFFPVFAALLVFACVSVLASRYELPSAKVLAAIAFIVGAAFWRVPEVILDSSRYFTQAKHLSEFGVLYFLREWGGAIEPWTDMPLVPFIYGIGFSVLGESRVVVQLITTSAFAGALWLTCVSARELFDKDGEQEIGPLAGAFLLSIPYLYSQVPLMLVDVPAMFFLVLGFFAFQRALKRGGWGNMAFASVAIFAMLISKYSQWMLASVYVLLFLLYLKDRPALTARRGLGVLAGTVFLFSIFLFAYQDVVREQMELLISYQRPGLRRWGESFLSTFFFQINPIVTFFAIGSAFVAFRKKDIRWLVPAWLVLLVLVMRIERSRYIVPLLPMLAITAAYGLNALGLVRIKRLLALMAVLGSIVIAYSAFMPYLRTNNLVNLMHAGSYLDEAGVDAVRVHTFPQKSIINPAVSVPLLDLYTSADIVYDYNLRPLFGRERIERSPFRFTWTYQNPAYYAKVGGVEPGHAAVVSFWSDETNIRRLPDGSRLLMRYDISEGIFRFKPYVSIFEVL